MSPVFDPAVFDPAVFDSAVFDTAIELALEVPLPLESTGFADLALELPLPFEVLSTPVVLALEIPLLLEAAGKDSAVLDVIFDVITALGMPLTVQFDVKLLGFGTDPLTIEFDIVRANPDGLTVTFDVLTNLVTRRTSSDIQGPVAEVTLS